MLPNFKSVGGTTGLIGKVGLAGKATVIPTSLISLGSFSPIFHVPYYFSRACAIGLRDTVVVTGGTLSNGVVWRPGARVQVYSLDGAQERLPDMNTARDEHACGHYVKDDKMVNHNNLCLGDHTVQSSDPCL